MVADMTTRYPICRCPAFPWVHAKGLAWLCVENTSDRFSIPRFLLRDTRDFRDTGNQLEKNYPATDWRSWPRR